MSSAKPHPGRRNLLDGLAIGVSLTCLVHCLALPLLIALLPAWSAWLDVPEAFHAWIIAFAAPFSLAILLRAARGRLWFPPLWLGLAGLGIMALGLGVHHPAMEAAVTSAGALILAAAHIANWRRRAHPGR